jgi:hypothetical protein
MCLEMSVRSGTPCIVGNWLLSLRFSRQLELETEILVSRWHLGTRAWVCCQGAREDGEEKTKAHSWEIWLRGSHQWQDVLADASACSSIHSPRSFYFRENP